MGKRRISLHNLFTDIDRELWEDIVRSIEILKRIYQLGNYVISLGTIQVLRKKIAKFATHGKLIVEVGSGPGTFLKLLRENSSGMIIGLDPSISMAYFSHSKYLFADMIIGVAEALPFKENSIDVIFCAFSFRDFFNKKLFLEEALRVLKRDGLLVILETNNPRKTLTRIFLLFIMAIGYFLSKLFLSRKNLYIGLVKSINLMKPVEYYYELAKRIGFRCVKYEKFLFDHAFIMIAIK